ncbi:phage portal protein [Corynebacterium poyangense]|uniref:Phage portal protein n=1 Tax=Corynebacterium poyangense TaxID=2684405 RepID=A0A7H0SQA2_9CORY|nr:phage portal protein [Corynebacterium poyangense]QNQ90727.1 phage portal protein [Corynebacterium poyangense]
MSTDELDEMAAEQLKLKLAQDDILVAEDPEVKFGVLDATLLDPFVNAWRSDIEALAAVSQTPAHALTGQLVNLNAEALAAARSPLTQKVYERQMSAAASYSRLIRTAGAIIGDDTIADDEFLRVTWQDMEIRSMSQAADALGKIATMLGVPARCLWGRIPGWSARSLQSGSAKPIVKRKRIRLITCCVKIPGTRLVM